MPQDFNTMQAQAIKYAQEMYNKSSKNVMPENENIDRTTGNPFTSSNDAFTQPNCRAQERKAQFRQSASPIKNILNSSKSSNCNDNDVLLIMALLLLLSQDGGDKMLMLALLYIMT